MEKRCAASVNFAIIGANSSERPSASKLTLSTALLSALAPLPAPGRPVAPIETRQRMAGLSFGFFPNCLSRGERAHVKYLTYLVATP